jgi:hypothetical protein
VVAEYVEDEPGRVWRPVRVGECPFGEGCRVRPHAVRHRKTGPRIALTVCRCEVHGRYFTVYPPGHVPYGRQRLAPLSVGGQVVGGESVASSWRGSFPRGGVGCRGRPFVAS